MLQDHDTDIMEMKEKVENMWKNCSSKRERKTIACRNAPGVSLFGDNIGRVYSEVNSNFFILNSILLSLVLHTYNIY